MLRILSSSQKAFHYYLKEFINWTDRFGLGVFISLVGHFFVCFSVVLVVVIVELYFLGRFYPQIHLLPKFEHSRVTGFCFTVLGPFVSFQDLVHFIETIALNAIK